MELCNVFPSYCLLINRSYIYYFGVCVICSLIRVILPVGSIKSSTSTRVDGNNFALYKLIIDSRIFFHPSLKISPCTRATLKTTVAARRAFRLRPKCTGKFSIH
jgi:hypothetical protein